MPRTKIVATLGPASEPEDVLRDLIRSGVDVFRINFSHGDHATHARNIVAARRLAAAENKVLAVLADLQGPRIRIGEIAAGSAVLVPGATVTLTSRPVLGDEQVVNVPLPQLVEDVRPGSAILIDDGLLEVRVLEKTPTDVICRVVVGGVLTPHKGMNLPGLTLGIPSITDKDRGDLAFALSHGVDYVAMSFVRAGSDIEDLRALMGGIPVPIIAKIEKHEAVARFDEILAHADGVMVARGDLGVELPAEGVPVLQKTIIHKANAAAKPVITATQMLDSMIRNPRPTRAEASDVANAIFDGSDAVMLSGETAIGKYPVETVRTMARIAAKAEEAFPFGDWTARTHDECAASVTDSIAQATCEISAELNVKAIVVATSSGFTARMVARHRPCPPIIGVTPNEATLRRLALVWGVEPLLSPERTGTDALIIEAVQHSVARGLLSEGDTVTVTAGVPLGGPGRTNFLKVHVVGDQGVM